MNNPVCLIGTGEMGGVFARGLLKAGHPVYPVTRAMDLAWVDKDIPDPAAVVVAVGEKDVHSCLKAVPRPWYDRLVLLQNELLPHDWLAHKISRPTVISVWFEKKRPQDYKVIIPSPVFGPHADLIRRALGTLEIPCQVLSSEDELVFELVAKNLYILTVNIAGLVVGGTVGELWDKHQPLARSIAGDVLDIQFRLIGGELDRERLIQRMVAAFQGDLQHKCMGRAAPERLARAIAQADEAGLAVGILRDVRSGVRK